MLTFASEPIVIVEQCDVLWDLQLTHELLSYGQGKELLDGVIFICTSEGVLDILYVFRLDLIRLSSFRSMCFIGMTSEDASFKRVFMRSDI